MPLTKVTPNNLHQTVKTMVQTMVDENSTDSAQVTLIVNSNIAAKSTDDISEGSNLYHTTARARSSISATGSLSYNSSTGIMSFTQGNTDTISEGSSNLYYTDERVDDRVGALVVGGNNITATYNDTAGTLTIDGQPGYADSDVGSYLSANGYGTSSSIIGTITASAPSTLDTLNELAAALGDDANFSTTVTNSIATKLPLAGGTITGDVTFADNAKATFGTGSDLEIYHDGTYSYIKDDTSSQMRFQNGDFQFYSANGFQNIAKFHETNGVDLYYQNSKKFETSSTGIDVTGNIVVSGTVDGRDVATDGTKLDGIETNADVTDATNVTAAGALMDTEVTNLAQVKAFDSTDYATAAQGTTADNALPKAGGTITGDVVFSGTNHSGVTWDTSEDEFLFAEGSRIDFGGGANIRRESDGILRITGATADDTYFNFSNNLIFYRGGSAAAQMMIAGSTQRFHAYGNITVGGTVDGRDVATDGTKLDGIESGATADQTKADIEGLGIDVPATNLTGTIPAARLSTATTQAESDDSTKIATTAYVTDKITTLIGGAPSTLNDLNELAAAINDDANYNSTLTTALATKLPKAGGTMTGNVTFGDSNKVIFGAGSDASIFSDGTSGYARGFILQNTSGNQDVLTFAEGGATTLFHNNASKIATTSSGIDVTGNIVVSGTVDGRDVATDGTKLDGIESGATADQTAAQLLTAVKTVDGSGSGLDADLLDGLHASSFMRNQVTYSAGYSSDNDNINGIAFMRITGGNNAAFSGHHNLLQIPNSGSSQYDVQLAIETDGDPQFKFRAGYGGLYNSWSSWRQIWHDGNDGSGSGLDADTVDGIQGSSFLRSDTNDTFTGNQLKLENSSPSAGGLLLVSDDGTATTVSSGTAFRVTNNGSNGSYSVFESSTGVSDLVHYNNGVLEMSNSSGAAILRLTAPGNEISRIELGDGSNYGHISTRPDLGDGILFYENGSNRAMLRGGKFGIGTTNPGYKLSVDNGTSDGGIFKLNNEEVGLNVSVNGGVGDYTNSTRMVVFNATRFDSGTSPKLRLGGQGGVEIAADTNNVRMVVNGNGYVGIGTTSPGHILDVDGGSIRIQDVGQYIYFGTNSSVKIGTASGNSNDLYLGSADDLNMESNYIRFWRDGYYGSTEYGRLAFADDSWLCTGSSSHYLGIGITNPTEKLHVSGNILATGDITANSDISLKDNITPIPNALDKVLQIRGVTFNRNDIEDNPRHAGVIAQEVEKVLPEVVSEGEDGIKSVAYGNMVSLLIEAIKEQQEQIDMLKEKLESK